MKRLFLALKVYTNVHLKQKKRSISEQAVWTLAPRQPSWLGNTCCCPYSAGREMAVQCGEGCHPSMVLSTCGAHWGLMASQLPGVQGK